MSRVLTHLLVYLRGNPNGTACGMYHDDVKTTGTHKDVTCPRCKQYIKRTGDGPEVLKSLFRF